MNVQKGSSNNLSLWSGSFVDGSSITISLPDSYKNHYISQLSMIFYGGISSEWTKYGNEFIPFNSICKPNYVTITFIAKYTYQGVVYFYMLHHGILITYNETSITLISNSHQTTPINGGPNSWSNSSNIVIANFCALYGNT